MTKILKKILVVFLCCTVVYVLAFVILSRLSLRVQTACAVSRGEYEIRVDRYFYIPYDMVEIATNEWLICLNRLLAQIFDPLAELDYRLTGYEHWHATPSLAWDKIPAPKNGWPENTGWLWYPLKEECIEDSP